MGRPVETELPIGLSVEPNERVVNQEFVFDYWPTGSCDMECPFCYGAKVPDLKKSSRQDSKIIKRPAIKTYKPSPETELITGSKDSRPEMSLADVLKVISKLYSAGGKTITIAGGEPLLRKDTPEIAKYAYELGMKVYLSTDGTFVLKRYPEFKDFIHTIGLPLDGSTPEMNIDMGRRHYLHGNIARILSYFKENPPSHRVKVGTIVSKINLGYITSIGDFLFENPQLYKPDVWRLYQFESIGRGRDNADKYSITDEEFGEVCSDLETKFPKVDVSPRSNENHVNAYFFATPDGMLQVVNEDRHVSIADLLTIDQDSLNQEIASRQDTVRKVNENRDWLSSPVSPAKT